MVESETIPNNTTLFETETYRNIIADEEVVTVIGQTETESLTFDKEQYSVPTYLSFARWISSSFLREIITNLENPQSNEFEEAKKLKAFNIWNASMGINGYGLLLEDEVNKHYRWGYQPVLPRPVSRERIAIEQPSTKFDSRLGTSNRIAEILLRGDFVGITHGTFDLLTMGHVDALFEYMIHLATIAKKHNKNAHMIVGIDSNDRAKDAKGENRPLLSFPQRVSAMCNFAGVGTVFMFPNPSDFSNIDLKNDYFSPLYWYAIGNTYTEQQIIETKKRYEDYRDLVTLANKRVYYYVSEEDPSLRVKQKGVEAFGGNLIALPQKSSVHTSDIERIYQVKQPRDVIDEGYFKVRPWFDWTVDDLMR